VRRHITWKRHAGHLLRLFPRNAKRSVILIYHAVASGPWSVPERIFCQQMAWLAENAHVVSLDDLLEGSSVKGLRVALTFDDGYESLYRVIQPTLQRLGFMGAAYLTTACIRDGQRIASDQRHGHYPDERFLLWREVIALHKLGWLIGSHGSDHVDMTRQSDAYIHTQLQQSKDALEQRLGKPCEHFSYPWGRHNSRVRSFAARCGYRWATGGLHGPVPVRCNPYAVPRIDVRKDYEIQDFVAAVRGDWDYLKYVQLFRRSLR
jgi:peptidoglycan/xylan/chitin deacetylase (PgdA/CDA1 family)